MRNEATFIHFLSAGRAPFRPEPVQTVSDRRVIEAIWDAYIVATARKRIRTWESGVPTAAI